MSNGSLALGRCGGRAATAPHRLSRSPLWFMQPARYVHSSSSRASSISSSPAAVSLLPILQPKSPNLSTSRSLRSNQQQQIRKPFVSISSFHQTSRNYSQTPSSRSKSKMVAEDYETVLKGKYPSKAHCKRVAEIIRKKNPNAAGVLYLEGTMTHMQEDNDAPVPFRQRRYFYYLTGCNLADCHFAYDIQSSKSTLFIPPIEPDDVIWSGLPVTIDEALSKYDVDEVRLTTEVNSALTHLGSASSQTSIYAIPNQVSDHITFLAFEEKDFALLKPAIEEARVVKDEYEVAMIRKANKISGDAHKAVVQRAKTAKNEQELEATFLERCVAHGAKEQAYHPIMASGRAASTLHYGANDAPLEGKHNCLVDAGAEWENYASDITRTFPINGKFTKETRDIYDIVYKMQKDCTAAIKEGENWDDIHLLAHKIAIDGLLRLGILKGDAAEILKAETSAAFFPHGLGHWLGLDTHDKGGNPNPKDPNRLFRYLRLRGVMPAGGVVTVEPGIYFCNFIIVPYLKDAKHKEFIDSDVLDKYWDVGGVRIEDNVLVTKDGFENLTDAIKEPGEIEAAWAAA